METRVCKKCGKEKPLEKFPRQARNKNLRVYACRTCRSSPALRNPETWYRKKARAKWRKLGINITWDEYEALEKAQGGRCAICGEIPENQRLSVDHCHESGKIRGLLCQPCNLGLGSFKDDKELLGKAKAYLEK